MFWGQKMTGWHIPDLGGVAAIGCVGQLDLPTGVDGFQSRGRRGDLCGTGAQGAGNFDREKSFSADAVGHISESGRYPLGNFRGSAGNADNFDLPATVNAKNPCIFGRRCIGDIGLSPAEPGSPRSNIGR